MTLGGAHVPLTKVFRWLTCLSEWNHCKTTRRCSDQYVYVGFSWRKISRSVAYTIAEKAFRFRHPDYNQDRAQRLICSSMSRHLSTRNISSKSMRAFLSNLANRQTDKRANAFTSSFVGGGNTRVACFLIHGIVHITTAAELQIGEERMS